MLPGPKSDINATSRLENQGRSRALLIDPLTRKSEITPPYPVGSSPQMAIVSLTLVIYPVVPTN
ncbi:hypothetical protein L4D06_17845 [Enterovibrio makurazakiensis]|uniref:hypothetical protein n=1 Tax=Enterovibrio makurazakiensis TaxID=2910232 RepID=UPI003D1CEB03